MIPTYLPRCQRGRFSLTAIDYLFIIRNVDKYELYYQVAKSSMDDQDQRNRELQGKAVNLASLSVLLLSIVVVILNFFGGDQAELGCIVWSLLAVACTVFVGAVFACVQVLRVQGWVRNPAPRYLNEHLENPEYDDATLTKWTADAIDDSVEKNESVIKAKSEWLSRATIGVAVLVLMVVALAIATRF